MVYTQIETGMRRAAVAKLDLGSVDFAKRILQVQEKGGNLHGYKISRQGLTAIKEYLAKERAGDDEKWNSPALFLPAKEIVPANLNVFKSYAPCLRQPIPFFL